MFNLPNGSKSGILDKKLKRSHGNRLQAVFFSPKMKPFINRFLRRWITLLLLEAFFCLELLTPIASAQSSDSLRPRNVLKRTSLIASLEKEAADGGRKPPLYIGAIPEAAEAVLLNSHLNQLNRRLYRLIDRLDKEKDLADLHQREPYLEELTDIQRRLEAIVGPATLSDDRKTRQKLQARIEQVYRLIEETNQKKQDLQDQKPRPADFNQQLGRLIATLEAFNAEQQHSLRRVTALQIRTALLYLTPERPSRLNSSAALSSLVGARNNLGRISREIRWSVSRKFRQAFTGDFEILGEVGGKVRLWAVLYIDGDKWEFLNYLKKQKRDLTRLSPLGFYEENQGRLYARLVKHFESQEGYAHVYRAWAPDITKIMGRSLSFREIPKEKMPEEALSSFFLSLQTPYQSPPLRVRREIEIGSLSKMARRPVHILLNQQNDYNTVLDAATRLEDIAFQLGEGRPSEKVVAEALEDLGGIQAWAERGKKKAKRHGADEMAQAVQALHEGQLPQAAHLLKLAVNGTDQEPRLRQRLDELEWLERGQEKKRRKALWVLKREVAENERLLEKARNLYRAVREEDVEEARRLALHLQRYDLPLTETGAPGLVRAGKRLLSIRDILEKGLPAWSKKTVLAELEAMVKEDIQRKYEAEETARDGGKKDLEVVRTAQALQPFVQRWYEEALSDSGKFLRFPPSESFKILHRLAEAVSSGWIDQEVAEQFLRRTIKESRYVSELFNRLDDALEGLRMGELKLWFEEKRDVRREDAYLTPLERVWFRQLGDHLEALEGELKKDSPQIASGPFEPMGPEETVRFEAWEFGLLGYTGLKAQDRKEIQGILRNDRIDKRTLRLLNSKDDRILAFAITVVSSLALGMERASVVQRLRAIATRQKKGKEHLQVISLQALAKVDPLGSRPLLSQVSLSEAADPWVKRTAHRELLVLEERLGASDGGHRLLGKLGNPTLFLIPTHSP